jgi:hypothetical protein
MLHWTGRGGDRPLLEREQNEHCKLCEQHGQSQEVAWRTTVANDEVQALLKALGFASSNATICMRFRDVAPISETAL